MTSTDYDECRVVCLGRVFRNGKLYVRFGQEDDPEHTGLWLVDKSTKRYQAGGIYRVPMNAERSSAQFSADPWQNMDGRLSPEETVALKIASEAADAQQRAFKTSKKVGDAEEVLTVLEPLRRIYRSADRTNRRLIELTIIDYLRKGA